LFGAVLRYSIKKATAVSGDSISNAFDEKGWLKLKEAQKLFLFCCQIG
jgi:hypothetical protein